MRRITLWKVALSAIVIAIAYFYNSRVESFRDAIESDRVETVMQFIKNDRHVVNRFGFDNRSPLMFAIEVRSKHAFEVLLENGADPNLMGLRGTNAIYLAAENTDPYWLRMLLEHGGDPNLEITSSNVRHHSTPLQEAAQEGRVSNIVLLLEDYHAEINHIANGQDALVRAASSAQFECVLELLKRGADFRRSTSRYTSFAVYMRQKREDTYKSDAIRRPLMQVIQWLKDHGVEHDKPTLKDGVYVYE